jgi:hypothetical protein
MKKLFAIAALGLVAVSGWAQSLVQFQNSVSFVNAADRNVYSDRVGGTLLAGTNYVVGLWYIPGAGHTEIASPAAGTLAAGNNALTTGFFRAATSTGLKGQWLNATAVGNTRTLDGVAAGTFATLQVRVWDISKYANFNAAFNAGEYGWSTPFDWKAPVAGDPPSGNFMDGMRAFALVPEPSTIALGVLGAASLLFLRRRKA